LLFLLEVFQNQWPTQIAGISRLQLRLDKGATYALSLNGVAPYPSTTDCLHKLTMSDLYNTLPRDPEKAFLLLEKHFREECEQRIATAAEGDNIRAFYVDYIAQVLAAISELGLANEFNDRVPAIEDVDYNTYLNFSKDVKHYRTSLEIRHGRRLQGYSVSFDPATKEKLRHHIAQIRTIFDSLKIGDDRKEALFQKLNALEAEIDRHRTRFDAYAALVIETAGVMGEAVERSRVLRVLDLIAKVIWGAKAEEEAKQLPPMSKPKQIEPPRAPKPRAPTDFINPDDEIPF
jgi:hypothetical protein